MLGNHKADSFDGGRAASEPEQPGSMRELGLGWSATGRANSDDDDVRPWRSPSLHLPAREIEPAAR